MQSLDKHIPEPQRDTSSPFLMPIDNIFTVPGRGTVVVGTVKRGTVKKGETLDLAGFGTQLKTQAANMQIFKKNVSQAVAGSEECDV